MFPVAFVAEMRRRIPTEKTDRAFRREGVPQLFKVLSGKEVALRGEDVDHFTVRGQPGCRVTAQPTDDVTYAPLKLLTIGLAVDHQRRERRRRVKDHKPSRGN